MTHPIDALQQEASKQQDFSAASQTESFNVYRGLLIYKHHDKNTGNLENSKAGTSLLSFKSSTQLCLCCMSQNISASSSSTYVLDDRLRRATLVELAGDGRNRRSGNVVHRGDTKNVG